MEAGMLTVEAVLKLTTYMQKIKQKRQRINRQVAEVMQLALDLQNDVLIPAKQFSELATTSEFQEISRVLVEVQKFVSAKYGYTKSAPNTGKFNVDSDDLHQLSVWSSTLQRLGPALKEQYNKLSLARAAHRGSIQVHHAHVVHLYTVLEEVTQKIAESGLESSELIVAIDFTKSNLTSGKNSFGGKSLHSIEAGVKNPYQQVLEIFGAVMTPFDDDEQIPAFGFGDSVSKGDDCICLMPDGEEANGFHALLERYEALMKSGSIKLSGPTNFAPVIRKALEYVKQHGRYHILLIIADGHVTMEQDTREAIVDASHWPLSIVCIGVGDGPWDTLRAFDESLPTRAFDNLHFTEYTQELSNDPKKFAAGMLSEIPEQFKAICKLNLLGKKA